MAFINGTYRILYIKSGDAWFPVGCLTSNSFEESSEMLGTTTRDNVDGWTSSIPTNQSYSINFEGILTQDQESAIYLTYSDIKSFKRNRTLIEWKIDDDYGNDDSGYAYIQSLSTANAVDEFVSFSGTMVGSGLSVESTFLLLEDGAFALLETGFKIIL